MRTKKDIKNIYKGVLSTLNQEEKEMFFDCVMEEIPAIDLLDTYQQKIESIEIGDVLLLKNVLKIGYEFVTLHTEKDEIIGCKEKDFEGYLEHKVEVKDFYYSFLDNKCVDVKIIK